MKIFEWFVTKRLRLNKDFSGTSQSNIIAITGIAITFIVILLSFAIVTGFKNEISNKVIGFDSQITITPTSNNEIYNSEYIYNSDTLISILHTCITKEANISLLLNTSGILKTENNYKAVIFKGVDNNYNWSFIQENLINGKIPDYTDDVNNYNIVISDIISNKLQLDIEDNVYAYFFIDGNIKSRKLRISGIYNSNFSEYDEIYVFTPISFTQKVNNVNNNVGNCIEINKIGNYNNIEHVSNIIQDSIFNAYNNNIIRDFYEVKNIYQRGAIYFNWLELIDMNVVIILILMSLISGFTLISSLFIIILEKVNMIGIFKSLGATNSQIRHIFIFIMEKLILKGLFIGNLIGLILIFIQKELHIIPLNAETYYLNFVPIDISINTIILINFSIIIGAALILIIPTHIISKISPIKTIRHE